MSEFRGRVVLETDEAKRALNDISEASGDAKESVNDLSQQGTRGLREMGNAAEGASSNFGSLSDVSARLQSINLQGTFSALRGALDDVRDVLGNPQSGAGLLSQMLQLGASGAEIGSMFGPQGALVGGIIGSAIPAINSLVAEMTSLESVNYDVVESYDQILGRLTDVQRRASQSSTLALGLGTLAEQEANRESARQRLETLRGVLSPLENQLESGIGLLPAEYEALQERVRVLRDGLTQFEREFETADDALRAAQEDARADETELMAALGVAAKDEQGRFDSGRSGGARGSAQSDSVLERNLRALDDAFSGRAGDQGINPDYSAIEAFLSADSDTSFLQDLAANAGETAARFAEADQAARDLALHQGELANAAKEASLEFSNSWRGSVDDVIQSFNEANQAATRAGTVHISRLQGIENAARSVGNQFLQSMGEDVSSAFAASVSAAIQGAESFEKVLGKMLQSLLDSLLQEAIVQALRETALGIADAASYKYDSSAMHFAAAGAWAAVAVGAGLGLGAVSAANAGGTSGPSAAANAAGSPRDDDSRNEGGRTYNVYYNNPMFATKQDQLRMFRELEREARR